MDQETLFTGSKWDILKLLESKGMSPLELANKSGTSIANISQQLRFLEMAGIVTSRRVSNREKGQPRIIYSLAGNNSYIIAVTPGFVHKDMYELDERKKAFLRIWFYKRKEYQYFIEKALTTLQGNLNKIQVIALDESQLSGIRLSIVSDQLKKSDLKNLELTNKEGQKAIVELELKDISELEEGNYYSIYDPDGKLQRQHKLQRQQEVENDD